MADHVFGAFSTLRANQASNTSYMRYKVMINRKPARSPIYQAPNLSSPSVASAHLDLRSVILFQISFISLNATVSSDLNVKLPFPVRFQLLYSAHDQRLRFDDSIDQVRVS